MKIVTIIARILMGVIFIIFGANLVHPFLHLPMPTGPAGQMMTGLYETHFLILIGLCQVIGGLLMLIGLYVTLGLVILGPVLVCIIFYHFVVVPSGIPMALFMTLLWCLVAWAHKHHLAGIFSRTA